MSDLPEGQVAWFTIWPETKHGLCFNVRVFEKRKQMVAAARSAGHLNASKNNRVTKGAFCRYRLCRETNGRQVVGREFGTMYLCRTALGTSTIVHESVHAAAAWWRRKRGNSVDWDLSDAPAGAFSPEEEFAYFVSGIARLVVEALHELELLP